MGCGPQMMVAVWCADFHMGNKKGGPGCLEYTGHYTIILYIYIWWL